MRHRQIARIGIALFIAPFAWISCGGDDSSGSTTAGGTAGSSSTGRGSTSSTSGGTAGSSSTSGGATTGAGGGGTGSGTTSTGTGGTTGSGGTSGNPPGCPATIPQDGTACDPGSPVCDYPAPIDPDVTLHCRCENMKWLCLD